MLLQKLFESAELPAEFVTQAETLFEAAVKEKVDAEVGTQLKALQESFDQRLEESKNEFITEAVKTIDELFEETILEWAKENAVGLDSTIKTQLAENFLGGLKGLFEKADIELTGDGTASKEIQKLNEEVESLRKQVAETQTELTESKEVIIKRKIKDIITESTIGLADTTVHRVTKLCESFDFKSEEDYREKVKLVVEAVTPVQEKSVKGTQDADGVIIPVDGGAAKIAKVEDGSGAEPKPELVDPHKKPELDQHKGADGLKESTDLTKIIKEASAPHYGEDLVALTLKMMK